MKLIENPLASAVPTEIKKGAIASRERVATSTMPKGLLDKLTREEILEGIHVLLELNPALDRYAALRETITKNPEWRLPSLAHRL